MRGVVGALGAVTAAAGEKGRLGIRTGDGCVQGDDVGLPGGHVVLVKSADPTPIAHLKEVGYSGVVNVAQAVLGQQPGGLMLQSTSG